MKAIFKLGLLFPLLLVGFEANVLAQSTTKMENGKEVRYVKPGLLRERTYKRLNKLYELIGEEQYAEALTGLDKLWPATESFPYERAVLAQAKGHVFSAQEKYPSARKQFEVAVELDSLPNLQHYQAMFGVAQLFAVEQRYKETIKWLKRWFAEVDTPPRAEAYVLLANAYAQQSQFRPAIKAIKSAIDKSDKPKENWYQLLMAMHYELKEIKEAAVVLEILVRMRPDKKEYWTQLGSMYMNLKRDEDALATMALAHANGLLDKEADWKQLYSLYGYLKVPFKAASILKEGLDKGYVESNRENWENVANAWYAANEQENALEAFAKASQYSENGKIDMRRGYILVDLERWPEVIDALTRAINKGGIKDTDTGNAWLMIGMAEFELGRLNDAGKAFVNAKRYKKTKRAGQQWLNHLKDERKRRDAEKEAAA